MSSTTVTPLPSPPPVHAKAKKVIDALNAGLIDRDECIRVLLLGLLTGQNVLVLGPPGTAKSKVVTDLFNRVEATSYKNVLHASISPETLVGPADLELLKTNAAVGKVLLLAELVFLDEVFKASGDVLSILLRLLSDRVIVHGSVSQAVPLHFAVGASDEVFLDTAQSLLLEQFPLRVFVDRLDAEKRLELAKGVVDKSRPHRQLAKASAAAAAAEKNLSTKTCGQTANPDKLDLAADIFAMLDAIDSKGPPPLPEDVQNLLFRFIDIANEPVAEDVEMPTPDSHTMPVITDRGIVIFSDMVRIMAHLHGRPQTTCILDLYPLVYMACRTKNQLTTKAEHFVSEITWALPELVQTHGAAWAYAVIRDHLFVPAAVKAELVSHLLADMIRAGLGDEALEALTKDTRVNPHFAIESVMALGHEGLISWARLDDRTKYNVEKWEKNRAEQAAMRAAEEAEEKRRLQEPLVKEYHELTKAVQQYEMAKRALAAEWDQINAEHERQFHELEAKSNRNSSLGAALYRATLDAIEKNTGDKQAAFKKKEAAYNEHAETFLPGIRQRLAEVQRKMEAL
ncbi:hypothetical protein AMAG_02574 [Allomyces macrogynus ATCC 38327]|uniref:MoxR domain-containing protein n=1 Tax=Allomyces macrogynus (strain ATCC 38327) TaxID=578462 RepID=A0A0L0S2N2_ALLM3|nr:hypothetical protein AMAG_02574 [Allomyces macrogynus ATCC 38327]|eukprot:KNE56798.1 hypothetical protein AMAG_02574 [Allomyces macrogynus ATCC 38327]